MFFLAFDLNVFFNGSSTGASAIYLRKLICLDITASDYDDQEIEENITHNCRANGITPVLPHLKRESLLCSLSCVILKLLTTEEKKFLKQSLHRMWHLDVISWRNINFGFFLCGLPLENNFIDFLFHCYSNLIIGVTKNSLK